MQSWHTCNIKFCKKKVQPIIANLFQQYSLNGEELGTGIGKSKKEAEQQAAEHGIDVLKEIKSTR